MFTVSSLVYLLGRYLSPKPAKTENGQSIYVCGEKATSSGPRISVSLYKYLIYFAVLDSSVLLLAFASLGLSSANVVLFMLYLSIMIVSAFLLLERGDQ